MFFEREDALASIFRSLSDIQNSGGRAVFVSGEAGIGKTTLLERFLADLPSDQACAVALCDPLETPRPLGAVRDLEAALYRRQAAAPGDTALFEGFFQQLERASRPTVLIIEDLHWVDRRSIDWLQFVGRRLSQLPVLLVGSFRDDDVDAAHPLRSALGSIPARRTTRIELSPLSINAIRKLGRHDSLSTRELRDITGGNPFYLTELVNNEPGEQIVPNSVADAVNARLNSLPEPLCRFLERASCCPGAIPYAWISKAEKGPEFCDTGVQRNILVSADGHFKFRHELARLAVYDRMPPAARRAAHNALLDTHLADGAREDVLNWVVHHAIGAHRGDVLLVQAPRAAAYAAKLGAHREAAAHLAHVLPHLDGQPPAFAAETYEGWAYEAGLAMAIDDDVIAARQKAVELWREVGDLERVGENLYWLSRLHWYRGEADQAQNYVHKAIAVLEKQTNSPARAKAYALRAQFHMLHDQMPDAIKWGEKAKTLADDLGADEVKAHALNTIGSSRMFRGDATGETMLRESLAISLAQNFHEQAARVYTNLSECLIEDRKLQEAADLLEEGIAFDAAHDLDAWTFYLVGRKAHLLFEMDSYTDALKVAEDVLTRENQTLLMRMPATIIRARAKLRLGKAGAIDDLISALEQARKIDEPQYISTLNIALVEAAVLADDPLIAKTPLDWLEALESDQLSPRKRGEAHFWASLVGRQMPRLDAPTNPSAFRKAAKGEFKAATAGFLTEQSRYLASWSTARICSPKAVREADQEFGALGASAAQLSLRKRFDIPLGALKKSNQRSASKHHPYGLTRAELVVLTQLIDGKSNAAIADTLCRSRRTVENHVASLFSKLRCKNRVDVLLRCQSEPWILPLPEESP